jgi:hypothetical protein
MVVLFCRTSCICISRPILFSLHYTPTENLFSSMKQTGHSDHGRLVIFAKLHYSTLQNSIKKLPALVWNMLAILSLLTEETAHASINSRRRCKIMRRSVAIDEPLLWYGYGTRYGNNVIHHFLKHRYRDTLT